MELTDIISTKQSQFGVTLSRNEDLWEVTFRKSKHVYKSSTWAQKKYRHLKQVHEKRD